MNHISYKKWLQKQLIPNLKQIAVVVDSGSHHEVQINWLLASNARNLRRCLVCVRMVQCSSIKEWVKMCALYKSTNRSTKFATEVLLVEHGHKVSKLPPHHPDLNPQKKLGSFKEQSGCKNIAFKLQVVQTLENFGAVTGSEGSCLKTC
jgi:hypothetical protein